MTRLITILILAPALCFAQPSEEDTRTIDSLKEVIKNAANDTVKVMAMFNWDNIIYAYDPVTDERLNHEMDSICSQYSSFSNGTKEYYFFGKFKASANNNLGLISKQKGAVDDAIRHYRIAIKISEEIGYNKTLASAYNNLGTIYYDGEINLELALEYYQKGLDIRVKINDQKGRAGALVNIGSVMFDIGDTLASVDRYKEALVITKSIGDNYATAAILSNLGSTYYDYKDYTQAEKHMNEAVEFLQKTGDIASMSEVLANIGIMKMQRGDYTGSITYLSQALDLAKSVKAVFVIHDCALALYESYKKTGRAKMALEAYELHISARDTIASEENQKELIRQEYQHEYEKQAAADSIKALEEAKVKDAQLAAEQAENKQHQLEAKQQEQQKYFLFGGLALALLFGGFVFNRFRVTSKQKDIIEEQKKKVDDAYDELEEKNTEILDSINYAKRIQSAILPPTKVVKEYLPESFVLYKPKDIVAGDFYWMEVLPGSPPKEESEEVGNTILFAAADCTGHGVPGAMVSVVCNNGLNRSVREYGLIDPGEILDKTREIVISEFEKSEEEVKDGMDIALCSLQGTILKYAGAHNPLWIIRKTVSAETGESFVLEEVKADKQPIGKYDNPVPYSTHTITLNKGDSFYIFSDGYADQFGGEKGKKLKAANFKKLLLSIQSETMEKQRELIDEAFEKWKGTYEQLDDVCVIGVKV